MNFLNRNSWLLGLVIFLIAFIKCWIALDQTNYANGWDGYYYVMQMESWVSKGHLQSLDYSIIYPYFVLIYKIVGDYVIGYKIGVAILYSVLVVSFYLVFLRNEQVVLALLVCSYLLFSPTLVYLSSQFPKNLLGLIFLVFFLESIIQKKIFWGVVFFLLAIISHRMIGGICILIALTTLIQKVNWKWIVMGFIGIGVLSLLPGVLHISDLQRFDDQLSPIPKFAPWEFYLLFEKQMPFWWSFELITLVALIIFFCYSYVNERRFNSELIKEKLIDLLLLSIIMFPFFVWNSGSMGYRFFLIFPVIVALVFLPNINSNSKFIVPSILILLTLSAFTWKTYDPDHHDPPNKQYEIVVSRLQENYKVSDFDLIVTHKGLAEMVIYLTDFDALNWSAPSHLSQHRVLRIVGNIDFIHLARYLNDQEKTQVVRLGLHYFALPESLWTRYYERVKSVNDKKVINRISAGGNPMEERPYYLTKGVKK